LFYDAAGNPTRWKNLTDGSNDSLFWDAENRLIRHKRRASGGSVLFDVQYTYDGFGRRVRRQNDGSDTLFVWDGWHLLAATSNTGTALRRYTYFPGTLDVPLAQRVGSTTTYFRLDGQGNVYQTRTTGGTVQAEYRYRAWGDRYNAATETVPSPFTYKAREEDRTTGLVYMRHRYYSPRLERFVNEDPIRTLGGRNEYLFANGSPTNLRDPMGLVPCGPFISVCVSVVGAAIGVIEGIVVRAFFNAPTDASDYVVDAALGATTGFAGWAFSLGRQAARSATGTAAVATLNGILTVTVTGQGIVSASNASRPRHSAGGEVDPLLARADGAYVGGMNPLGGYDHLSGSFWESATCVDAWEALNVRDADGNVLMSGEWNRCNGDVRILFVAPGIGH
ncbi:MAG: RHS repeat-associated core domain-containing protein, partial [Gemmatimonadales bacterium]